MMVIAEKEDRATTTANETTTENGEVYATDDLAGGRMKDSSSVSEDKELAALPSRPSLEEPLHSEPTQLVSAVSEVSGCHPEDVESNDPRLRLEQADAELVIQPEPNSIDAPPLVDAQPLRRRRGLVLGLVAVAVVVVGVVIGVTVAVVKPKPISPAPTMSPTVNAVDSTPLVALLPELRARWSNATKTAIETEGSPQQQAFQWLVSSRHPPSSAGGVPDIPPLTRLQHRFALATLYFATGGASAWVINTGWLDSNVHECDWHGWNCTVHVLELSGNGMRGTLPREFCLLPMNQLNLMSNQLTGSLPTELGQSSSLETLILGRNQFRSTIPTEWSQLSSSLKILALGGNDISGTIPTVLGQLTELRLLYLSPNPLRSGPFPSEFTNLTNLEELGLYDLRLTGTLPVDLVRLSNLRWLELSQKQSSWDYSNHHWKTFGPDECLDC